MTSSLRRRLRIAWVGVILGAVFGTVYAVVVADRSLDAIPGGALTGALIAGGIGLLEVVGAETRAGRRVRRLPFAAFVAIRTTAWVAWISAVLLLLPLLLYGSMPSAVGVFGPVVGYSLAVSLLVVAVLELNRLLGHGTLWKLVSGRYHRPRVEQRAFLLIDLVGSTTVAERIGDVRFLAFLDRLICDIGEDITDHRGEIYRYVGDAVIASWPIDRAQDDAAVVRCLFAVQRRVARGRSAYQREFEVEPVIRAVLHAGPIAVGEVGDSRREITFLGDTLNTAARLEKVCGELGHSAVISQSLLARLTLPPGVRAEALGEIPLAGKTQPVALHALTMATDARDDSGSD